jgi:hypothetical protein
MKKFLQISVIVVGTAVLSIFAYTQIQGLKNDEPANGNQEEDNTAQEAGHNHDGQSGHGGANTHQGMGPGMMGKGGMGPGMMGKGGMGSGMMGKGGMGPGMMGKGGMGPGMMGKGGMGPGMMRGKGGGNAPTNQQSGRNR